jgi:hypothetical protein
MEFTQRSRFTASDLGCQELVHVAHRSRSIVLVLFVEPAGVIEHGVAGRFGASFPALFKAGESLDLPRVGERVLMYFVERRNLVLALEVRFTDSTLLLRCHLISLSLLNCEKRSPIIGRAHPIEQAQESKTEEDEEHEYHDGRDGYN